MIYDEMATQQLAESIAALKTVQYALMGDDGVSEDAFAYVQASAIRSLEDAIARLQHKGGPKLNGKRFELSKSLRELFEYEAENECPELHRRIMNHQSVLNAILDKA
jgi:hypothetical protein